MADKASTKDGLPSKAPSKAGFEPADWFWESRKKGTSTYGTLGFTVLRALDLPLQWWLLRSGTGLDMIRRIGLTPIAQPVLQATTTALGLSPYHSLVFGLACGSSLKQIYWKLFVGDTVMPAGFSGIVAVYNSALNSLNTLLALWAISSQQPTDQSSLKAFLLSAPPALQVGLALYSVGLFTEWWCEIQRKSFKKEPNNQGKPYSGGLFSLARNINYGGYTLWRSGYSLICGGWVWAGMMCSFLAGDFINRAIPSMDAYCEKRYGEQWEEVRKKVPYRLLPWIY
ncbi:Hypothetical predicted protein [Lecanosticta acicola]|uniref:Steroid 5-alpha reductase C-terminal domain-containing protein n=1 Tax=Lecanosticta acicola TaxID=111012 RepID=A0AAI9EEV9_9PEZI|nr:Hypothetical predicted protein [Lecanosticta acicola]